MNISIKNLVKEYSPDIFLQCWRFLRPGAAGRELTVFDDDIFVVSYPKSGNTWMRFILANMLYKSGTVDFANIERFVPDIYKISDCDLIKFNKPRIIKSHEYFDPKYKKVIYIVRDPRDVVVSYYHYKIKMRIITKDFDIDNFVDCFMNGGHEPYGTWSENVGSWLGARGTSENFILIRYEDMLSDPVREIQKITSKLNLDVSQVDIKNAVDLSEFSRMRDLETATGDQWPPIKKSRKDVPFVRSGKSGCWRSELNTVSVSLIEQKWSDLMRQLDYRQSIDKVSGKWNPCSEK